jgi:hypothetical protein
MATGLAVEHIDRNHSKPRWPAAPSCRFPAFPFVLFSTAASQDETPRGAPHMLGRKNYTRDEVDHGRSAIDEQLAVYMKLVRAIGKTGDQKPRSALGSTFPINPW